jgi:NAD(P)-dependent dehydrogenase (short-subunit alcohol dehydrogenase family)
LGRAITETLARRGFRVFAGMREPRPIQAAGPGSVTPVRLDVLDPGCVHAAVDEAVAAAGRLDAVVCNAGVAHAGAFEESPPEAVRVVMDTNFFGALNTAWAALPALRASRGRLVLVSSDNGLYGTPGLSAYTASKFALEGWAESIAGELRPFGVRVVLVEPGAYASDIWGGTVYGNPVGPYGDFGAMARRAADGVAARARDPREVGEAVARALLAPRPRLRYAVGPDARLMAAVARLTPARLRGALIARALGLHRWQPPGVFADVNRRRRG